MGNLRREFVLFLGEKSGLYPFLNAVMYLCISVCNLSIGPQFYPRIFPYSQLVTQGYPAHVIV